MKEEPLELQNVQGVSVIFTQHIALISQSVNSGFPPRMKGVWSSFEMVQCYQRLVGRWFRVLTFCDILYIHVCIDASVNIRVLRLFVLERAVWGGV